MRLLFGDPTLRITIGAAVAALLFISASITVEVFYVRDVVGAGPAGYSLVFAGWMLGMVLGAIGVASRIKAPLAVAALVALALQGAGMAAAASSAVLAWVIAGFFVGGIGHGVKNVLLRTLIQQRVPAEAHGRAFAAYNAARNTAELGALGAGGVMVGVLGAQPALLIAGLGPVFAGLIGLAVLGYRPSRAAAFSLQDRVRDVRRQLEPVELGQARLRVEHRVVGPEAELPAQPARDLAAHLLGQVAVLPAADVEIDVGLVQRHRDGLEVPRPADVREHDPHVRVPRGDPVEQDRPREVDPQPLPARLAGAEPARPGVREQDQPELRGRVEERQEAVVAGIELLQRRVQLQALQPQLREPRQPLQRVLAVRIDRPEPDEPPADSLADRARSRRCRARAPARPTRAARRPGPAARTAR